MSRPFHQVLVPLTGLVERAPRPLRLPTSPDRAPEPRSEEHTSELQSRRDLVCRLLLEKKKMAIGMRLTIRQVINALRKTRLPLIITVNFVIVPGSVSAVTKRSAHKQESAIRRCLATTV